MKLIARPSVVEQVVDVFVGDLSEGRVRAGFGDFVHERLEDVVELFGRLLDAEADQTERAARVDRTESVPALGARRGSARAVPGAPRDLARRP